jgi:anti-anti-sigma regulatory factor
VIALVALRRDVKEIIEISGLSPLFKIYATRADALA